MYIHMMLVDVMTQKVVREEDFNRTNSAFAAAWAVGAADHNFADDMPEIMVELIAKTVRQR